MMKSLSSGIFDRDYNGIVLKTIENVLEEVFGQRTFKQMLQIMKEKYSLEWNEVPEKSQTFSLALRQVLGPGSIIIEDLIVENLHRNLGLELTWRKGFAFSDYISELPLICRTADRR